MTVFVDVAVERRRSAGTDEWVARGRANQDLVAVFSWVPDDAFGRPTLTGPRAFEVVLARGHELNTMLSGLPLWLRLEPAGGGAPVTAALTFGLRPRIADASVEAIRLAPRVAAVDIAGELVHRLAVEAPGPQLVVTPKLVAPAVTQAGPGRWNLDWGWDVLAGAIGDPITAHAGRAALSFTLVTTVERLAVTSRDPSAVWRSDRCAPRVQACLDGLPPDATDTGSCGSYREIRRCNPPYAEPTLFAAPEALDDIGALVANANARSPSHLHAEVEVYGYDWGRSGAPRPAQLARAHARVAQLPQVPAPEPTTTAAMRSILDEHGLGDLPAAFRRLLLAPRAEVQIAVWRDERPIAPGASAFVTGLMLHAPKQARVMVVTLTHVEQ